MLKTNMEGKYPILCPCCGEGNIDELHDICHVCGWEDDEVQNDDPTFVGGANKDSLNEHRKKFHEERSHNKGYKWINKL